MSSYFIVTPFGLKNGINFSEVEKELIRPVMDSLELTGGTTVRFIEQGNIRTDMFQQLLVADLVIADISIHNANAFYELGARHAFREKWTVLIRCSSRSLPAEAKLDEVPFDLKTDRYFEYDLNDLKGSQEKLTEVIQRTLDSQKRDSPIFQLLPKLEEYDPEVLLAVPQEFGEAVDRAVQAKQGEMTRRAGDLSLLAEEARGFEWEITGLRLAGEGLFELAHWERCRAVLETIRARKPLDAKANLLLGTVYHRLEDLTQSEQALERALSSPKLAPKNRAEAHALRARNAKQLWQDAWTKAPPDKQRAEALRSPHLKKAYEEYAEGYQQDQNAYFPGLNALAMLAVRIELATALPEVWEESFADPDDAPRELDKLKKKRLALAGAVETTLQGAPGRAKRDNQEDVWIEPSVADFRCLTSTRPEWVASAYRDSFDQLNVFKLGSVRRQLELYRQLGLFGANVDAALALSNWGETPPTSTAAATPAKSRHVILFTGHRVDAPGRAKPRFPADKEAIARQCIKSKLEARLKQIDVEPLGIAGGASGGDILFHEVCAELGVPTELYLALPDDLFVEKSVEDSGGDWDDRFYALARKLPKRVLADKEGLPVWLKQKENYGFWERNNLWMLHHVMAIAGEKTTLRDGVGPLGKNLTLLALWDGEAGDGPGGTKHMIEEVKKLGARDLVIETKKEFGL